MTFQDVYRLCGTESGWLMIDAMLDSPLREFDTQEEWVRPNKPRTHYAILWMMLVGEELDE